MRTALRVPIHSRGGRVGRRPGSTNDWALGFPDLRSPETLADIRRKSGGWPSRRTAKLVSRPPTIIPSSSGMLHPAGSAPPEGPRVAGDGGGLFARRRPAGIRRLRLRAALGCRDREKLLATLGGHTERVRTVAFAPDGKWLASAGDDQQVRLWDVAARRERPSPLAGHTPGWGRSVVFSPDGKTRLQRRRGSDDPALGLDRRGRNRGLVR